MLATRTGPNFLPAYGFYPPGQGLTWQAPGGNEGSLFFHLLPFIEKNNLYETCTTSGGGRLGYQPQWAGSPRVVKTYLAQADPTDPGNGEGYASYRVNYLAFCMPLGSPRPSNGASWNGPRMPATFRDGTSNTVCFAEGYARVEGPTAVNALWFGTYDYSGLRDNGPGYAADPALTPVFTTTPPQNSFFDRPNALSGNNLQIGLMDGSVRSISSNVTPQTWYSANHPSDGGVLGSDW